MNNQLIKFPSDIINKLKCIRKISPNDKFPCFSCFDDKIQKLSCKVCSGSGFIYGSHPMVQFSQDFIQKKINYLKKQQQTHSNQQLQNSRQSHNNQQLYNKQINQLPYENNRSNISSSNKIQYPTIQQMQKKFMKDNQSDLSKSKHIIKNKNMISNKNNQINKGNKSNYNVSINLQLNQPYSSCQTSHNNNEQQQYGKGNNESLISNENRNYNQSSVSVLKSDILQSSDNDSNNSQDQQLNNHVIHYGYCCDICSMDPIKGYRYHCQICQDFDLCYKCYKKKLHNHDFIIIKQTQSNKQININKHQNILKNIRKSIRKIQ